MRRGGSWRCTQTDGASSRPTSSALARSPPRQAKSSSGSRSRRPKRMRVTICDVGPRDGLQNEPETLPPSTRAELVNRLAGAGLPRIEAASFVRADTVPQMAGAEEVVDGIERRSGTDYSGLVL